MEQNDGENIGNLKIEHNNERVNGYNDIVDKIPQNTKTDEEVNGKNWTNEYGKKSEEPFSNYVIGDKHVCFKFNKLYKVAKRFNDMAWRCVHELPRLHFNKELISKLWKRSITIVAVSSAWLSLIPCQYSWYIIVGISSKKQK